MIPMKFTDITADEARIESLLTSPEWAVEQKMDGTRVLAQVRSSGVQFFNGVGSELAHTAATQHTDALVETLQAMLVTEDETIMVDGELMIDTGEYRLFDLPYLARDRGAEPLVIVGIDSAFVFRRSVLISRAATVTGSNVYAVSQARTESQKRELVRKVNESGAEGVMIKHLGSPYEPGKRAKTGLKVKLVKTADVIVIAVDRPDAKHGSFTFGVYCEAEVVKLGKCSAIGKPDAKAGDVIEVSYLYRAETGGLVQPRMMRIRDDKEPWQCGFDQFPQYSREAV